MGRIEELAAVYERQIKTPWQRTLAGAQRVLMVVYDKELESTFRARKSEFERVTVEAGCHWKWCDITGEFARWMADIEYHGSMFEDPEDLRITLRTEFCKVVAHRIRSVLNESDESTVVGVMGVASLFGFAHLSDVLPEVERDIRGRLVVFFPGHKHENNYRLLDARDGWNYLATSITL